MDGGGFPGRKQNLFWGGANFKRQKPTTLFLFSMVQSTISIVFRLSFVSSLMRGNNTDLIIGKSIYPKVKSMFLFYLRGFLSFITPCHQSRPRCPPWFTLITLFFTLVYSLSVSFSLYQRFLLFCFASHFIRYPFMCCLLLYVCCIESFY